MEEVDSHPRARQRGDDFADPGGSTPTTRGVDPRIGVGVVTVPVVEDPDLTAVAVVGPAHRIAYGWVSAR